MDNGPDAQIRGWSASDIDSDFNLLAPAGSDWAEGEHSIVLPSTTGIVVDAATGDFHLVPGSPALATGEGLSATGWDTDIEGVPRPRGAAWDIGAYQSRPGDE
jgi:hypothetical protein